MQKVADLCQFGFEIGPRMTEDEHVIHVAQVSFDSPRLLDPVVAIAQVEVGGSVLILDINFI